MARFNRNRTVVLTLVSNDRDSRMKEVRALFLLCTLLLVIGFAAMWDFGLLDGLGFHGTIAAVLGTVFTAAVAVGLVGLMIYSSRRHDRSAYDFWRRKKKD